MAINVAIPIANATIAETALAACLLACFVVASPLLATAQSKADKPAAEQAAGQATEQQPSADSASPAAQASRAGEQETAPPETAPPEASPQEVVFERVQVIADPIRVPGSAHVINAEHLAHQQYSDIHRILRQVPGLSVQEEDGYGLRPNIGIRGTGVERSQKVTLLEDGVLIAPAPYAAPAAYYSPTAGRMESFEVRKGSASIRQGPHTNGGVINYVSSTIPGDASGRVSLSAGEHGTFKLRGLAGASFERVGFLLETFQHQTDGFKELDGGGETGFELEDYLGKLRFNSAPGSRVYQELELKVGHTKQDGDETYLGLTAEDFRSNPLRRYRGSQLDNIQTDHDSINLRYFVMPAPGFDVTATVYRNDFFRNWYKNEATLGSSNGAILANPNDFATELAVLRGEVDSVDDALKLRNNRRQYYSEGVQVVLGWKPDSGMHQLQFGVRVHEDEEDRFQEDDYYRIRAGVMELTRAGSPGSQANRVARAESTSFFLQDQISFGRWIVTPGVRFESIETLRQDYGKSDPTRSGASLRTRQNEFEVVLPGIGVSYDLGDGWNLVAGAHRGFSPPGPSSAAPVDPEESINYEVGARYDAGATSFELLGFFSDYSNLLGADTLSGGGTGSGEQFNGGEVDIFGIEFGWRTQLLEKADWRVPVRVVYTWSQAEFQSNFSTSFADWSPQVSAGDDLPYLAENQLSTEIGLVRGPWAAYLEASYTSEMRTRAGRGPVPQNERIEDRLIFDLSANFELQERYSFFVQVRNLLDEEYVSARRPYGLRPGLPRSTLAGLTARF